MSRLSYFSDMFHNLGSLSIELNKALNTMARSYRTAVPDNDKKEAKEILSGFLSLLSEEDEASPPKMQQIRKGLEVFIKRQNIGPEIDLIRDKIESGKELSKPEIDIVDNLIIQISNQATTAFRRMG